MKINYEKKFLKDLESLDKEISIRLKSLIIQINQIKDFSEIKNIKKLVWYDNYYRIKLWDYRLWLKFENQELYFIRFKHRKDIYKIFP